MLHVSLVILTPLLQCQFLPALNSAGKAPAKEKTAGPPARAIAFLGTNGLRVGGVFHSLAYVEGDSQLLGAPQVLGAWYGNYELWRDGKKVVDHGFQRAKAFLAPDGKTVAMVMEERKILLLDVKTGKELRHFRGEAGPIAGVAWSPSGNLLAAGVGPSVFLWDTATGKVQRALTSDSLQHLALAFSPDGARLAGGDRESAQVWDTRSGVLVKLDGGFHGAQAPLAFARDGKILVGGCYEGYGNGRGRVGLRQWDAVTGKKIRDLEFGTFYSAALTPDGNDVWAGADRDIYRLQLKSGKQVGRWLAHTGEVRALALSRDGKTLGSAGTDLRVRFWNTATGDEQLPAHGHIGPILAVVFSADGASIASEGQDGTLRFWDAVSGKQQRRCPVTASQQRLVGLGLANGTLVAQWKPISEIQKTGFASSPDGRLLATAKDHDVVLSEADTGATLAVFSPNHGNISCLAFASHGRTLVSGSAEGGLTVWDVTGRLQGGALPPAYMSKQELREQVTLLRGGNAVRAHEAIWTLASAGPEVVPLMEEVLPRPATAAKIKRLIADLADPVFGVRDKAMKQLAEVADEAETALAETLENARDIETRRRVELLLQKLEERAVAKRSVQVRRALAVLEYAGTKEARSLLERAAKTDPPAPWIETVQAILKRWKTD